MRLYLLLVFCFNLTTASFIAKASGSVSENEKLLQQAEVLLQSYKDSEALLLYEQVLAASATNYEALCKASLLHCRIGDRYKDDSNKMEHFTKARSYALLAYELQPSDAEANYVMALAIANQAMVSGPKDRLIGINEVKSFLDAALTNDEKHAGAWHLLGRWYFKIANLNFAEKAASKMLFGGVCEIATNQDAANAIENAINYNPENIRYYLDLASIYSEMRNDEACITTLQKALTLNLKTKEELELSRRCKVLLQDKQRS